MVGDRLNGRRAASAFPARLDMTALLPELASLPPGLVLDGELVAFAEGMPHFPLVTRRLPHGDTSIPLTYVVFDALEVMRCAAVPDRLEREASVEAAGPR